MSECASTQHHPHPFLREGGAPWGLPGVLPGSAMASRTLLDGQVAKSTPPAPSPGHPPGTAWETWQVSNHGTTTSQHPDGLFPGMRGGRNPCGAALGCSAPASLPARSHELLLTATGDAISRRSNTRGHRAQGAQADIPVEFPAWPRSIFLSALAVAGRAANALGTKAAPACGYW